jgi:hypothetical protein
MLKLYSFDSGRRRRQRFLHFVRIPRCSNEIDRVFLSEFQDVRMRSKEEDDHVLYFVLILRRSNEIDRVFLYFVLIPRCSNEIDHVFLYFVLIPRCSNGIDHAGLPKLFQSTFAIDSLALTQG